MGFSRDRGGERVRESGREHAHPSSVEQTHTALSVCQSEPGGMPCALPGPAQLFLALLE